MTHAEWLASTDSRDLLRFSASIVPRQHLCLVLCEIATVVWPDWYFENPDDWRAALCVATLRAWCFDEATLQEVRTALAGTGADFAPDSFNDAGGPFVDENGEEFVDFRDSSLEDDAAVPAAVAIARALMCALTPECSELVRQIINSCPGMRVLAVG